jgi:tetratricopeptide (TPR) repeat protein
MNGDFPVAHLWLGRTYQELGRYDAAIAEFRAVDEKLLDWPVSIAARGYVEALAGRSKEAEATLSQLQQLAARKFVTAYGIALVDAGLGRKDEAFEWLTRAFDERSNWLVWLRLDPRWVNIRNDPRFTELVNRMHFPEPHS